eukprot:Awhi_evm2s14334
MTPEQNVATVSVEKTSTPGKGFLPNQSFQDVGSFKNGDLPELSVPENTKNFEAEPDSPMVSIFQDGSDSRVPSFKVEPDFPTITIFKKTKNSSPPQFSEDKIDLQLHSENQKEEKSKNDTPVEHTRHLDEVLSDFPMFTIFKVNENFDLPPGSTNTSSGKENPERSIEVMKKETNPNDTLVKVTKKLEGDLLPDFPRVVQVENAKDFVTDWVSSDFPMITISKLIEIPNLSSSINLPSDGEISDRNFELTKKEKSKNDIPKTDKINFEDEVVPVIYTKNLAGEEVEPELPETTIFKVDDNLISDENISGKITSNGGIEVTKEEGNSQNIDVEIDAKINPNSSSDTKNKLVQYFETNAHDDHDPAAEHSTSQEVFKSDHVENTQLFKESQTKLALNFDNPDLSPPYVGTDSISIAGGGKLKPFMKWSNR